MFELAIIGGGPAGVAAGVYAARKKLKTILITESFGGQSTESMGIENWIGTTHIPGADFSALLEEHLRAVASDAVTIETGERVAKVSTTKAGFAIETESGKKHEAKAVLVATGSSRRKLDVPGAKEYENKGITYCASCDGPLFAGQDVAVVGGGNAGFETAAQLLAYAKSVTLLTHGSLKADAVTIEKVLAHPAMKAIPNAEIKSVKGGQFVTGLLYQDAAGEHELPVTGIFAEIGLMPATAFVEELVAVNQYKQAITDPRTQRTSREGIWAAGDSTDGLFHQNNIAAGDAVKALEDIYLFLRAK